MQNSKRQKVIMEKIEELKAYPLSEAISLIQSFPKLKFNESIDVSVNLGVDPKKSDQNVRGSSSLPHGIGKVSKVAVFAEGPEAANASKAGADIVGDDDLVNSINAGNIDFDVLIATPDMMSTIGKVAKILGPKGLMPNPKLGTVTQDVKTAVSNSKAGQIQYKNDKSGIVHAGIGKLNFSEEDLLENLKTFYSSITKSKPDAVKGSFIKKVSIASTMGFGLEINSSLLR